MEPPARPAPARLRALLGWGMLGQLVYVASQFATLVGLTRFASIEEVGTFGLASAITTPVFFFFGLNMRINFASALHAAHGFREFRALLLLSAAAACLLVAGIGLFGAMGAPGALALLLVLAACKSSESLSELCYGAFQRHDRVDLVARSMILRSVASTALVLILLAAGAEVAVAFLGQLVVWALVALAFDHRLAARLCREPLDHRPPTARGLLGLAGGSVPLGLGGLLAALQGNAPRYAIAALLDVVALGAFTVVGYAMQLIATLVIAATDSVFGRLARLIAEGRRRALRGLLARMLAAFAASGALGVALSLLVGDRLVAAVFGPDYAGLGGLLAICVLAATLQAGVIVLQACVMAARRFALGLAIRVGSASAMLICCLAGGAALGLPGVVWGMCAAYALHILALLPAVRPFVSGPDRA